MFFSEKLKKISKIQHCFFSRNNGVSKGIYESLNCGIGSNDLRENVQKNLEIVSNKFNLNTTNLVLMNQTHSNKVEYLENYQNNQKVKADAIITRNAELGLGVLTADCAPILIFEKKVNLIGCIHAGWKGAVNSIIEKTIEKIEILGGRASELVASVGPCLGQDNYEVKDDFYSLFKKKSKSNEKFFSKDERNNIKFDLRGFVNDKLKQSGIEHIDNINVDTFAINNLYFSHRRAKKLNETDYGRCISVIKKIN